MAQNRRTIQTDAAPAAIGPYSQGVVAGSLLFCAGQIPLDPGSGELVPGGAGDQTRRCLANLEAVCEAAGTALADAVRLTVYLTDLVGDWEVVNAAYGEAFADGDPPARVAVEVAGLPRGARVEIEAVVAL